MLNIQIAEADLNYIINCIKKASSASEYDIASRIVDSLELQWNKERANERQIDYHRNNPIHLRAIKGTPSGT